MAMTADGRYLFVLRGDTIYQYVYGGGSDLRFMGQVELPPPGPPPGEADAAGDEDVPLGKVTKILLAEVRSAEACLRSVVASFSVQLHAFTAPLCIGQNGVFAAHAILLLRCSTTQLSREMLCLVALLRTK